MTNAWFLGAAHSVPQSESQVREQTEPIRHDPESAEMTHAPEFNEFESDESGQLTGLTHRVVGSDTIDTEKSAPFWAALANVNYNRVVDDQVSSSGTAAAREAAGVQGHGTMQYALGLEPIIRDGARMGNDYFVSHEANIQDGAGEYMAPTDSDHWLAAVAADNAERASRSAYQNSQYAAFLGG
jgi:hypothetical protein